MQIGFLVQRLHQNFERFAPVIAAEVIESGVLDRCFDERRSVQRCDAARIHVAAFLIDAPYPFRSRLWVPRLPAIDRLRIHYNFLWYLDALEHVPAGGIRPIARL